MKNNERIRIAYEKARKHGMTYQKLADLTGVNITTLTGWLTGKRNPPNHVADLVEERVSVFLSGGKNLYINKTLYRDRFIEQVYNIFENHSQSEQPREIIKAFENIPTVTFKKKEK